jgi:hypothetical protein
MDMFSQINTEINAQVLRLCQNVVKNYSPVEVSVLYKMWIDTLPREVTEEEPVKPIKDVTCED